ncbi:MAG: sigma 54-interacting transcriptional regulator [Candidatus Hatepunaea meridiana]|nr:sigma 54-interacting transcriptional regulator [Candidatus Hatepunaea meridiana]
MGKSQKTGSSNPKHHLRLKPGQVVSNRYLVKEVLGQGGIGEVYLVSDQQADDTRKALKLVREDYLNLEISKRFVKEFQLLHLLKHSGIVYCYEYGRCDAAGEYFTMEYIDWPTLDTINEELSSDLIIRILYDLVDTLSFVHNHQIAHYDLKPNNIFIDIDTLLSDKKSDTPIIKIGDFGLADLRLTEEYFERRGTYIYSAPEMFQDGNVDMRADLFSVGMIGFTLLTESHPYSIESDMSLLQQKQHWLPDQITWDNAGVPSALAAILTRCLNPNPAFRPRNTSEIIAELSRFTSHRTSSQVRLLTTPFVGRVGEMRHLGSIMHEVESREQWAFLIYGDTEIGKSRLIDEFALNQQLKGIDVIRLEGNDLAPFFRYFNFEEEKFPPASPTDSLDDILRRISYKFEDNLTLSDQACLIPGSDQASLITPTLKPLVLCWHKFDSGGTNLIRAFKENLLHHPYIPILWLLESKNDIKELSSLSYSDHLIRRHLTPLGEDEVEILIGELLRRPHNYQVLSKHLFSYAGGEPGWLLHILRQLIDKKHIIYKGGNWHILDPDVVSSTQDVGELLKVDLNKLSTSSRWVIEWLATLLCQVLTPDTTNQQALTQDTTNQKSDIEEIIAAVGIEPNTWSDIINELTDIGLIDVIGGQIGFRLPVLRELAYKNISPSQRSQLHLRVGRWLEENRSSDNNIEALISIAHHYHIANESAPFLRIVEKILDLFKDPMVVHLDPDVLKAALAIEESPLNAIYRYRCYELLGKVYLNAKRYGDGAKIYQILLSDSSLKKYGQIGTLYLELGKCLALIQDFDGAQNYLIRAFNSLKTDEPEAVCQVVSPLAYVLYQNGNFQESLEYVREYYKLVNNITSIEKKRVHWINCGKLFILHNYYENAYDCYTQVIEKSISPWESPAIIKAYQAQIELMIKQGNWIESINLIDFIDREKTLSVNKWVDWYNPYLRAMAMISGGQIERGLNIYEEIEQNIKVHAIPIHFCRILLDLIRVDYFRGCYWQGMHRIRQSMRIVHRLKLEYLQAVIQAWAIRFRDMMKKQSDKLIKRTNELIIKANHPLSDCLASFLLTEHYLEKKDYINAISMLNLSFDSVSRTDFEIPLSLLEIMRIRHQASVTPNNTDEINFEELEALSYQIKQEIDKGEYYLQLLHLAVETGKIDFANSYCKRAINCFKKTEANLKIGHSLEVYGNACKEWKRHNEAQQILNQAAIIYKGLGLPYQTPDKVSLESSIKGDNIVTTERFPPLHELAEVIDMLNTMDDPDKLTHKLLKMALDGVGAERGLIIFRREKTPGLSRRASIQVGLREAKTISRTIAEQVFKSNEPIFSDNALGDENMQSLESIQLSRIRAVACLPIISKGETEGVLYLDNRGSFRGFTDADKSYLRLLTNLTGTVLTHSRFVEVLREDVKTLRRNIDLFDGYDEFKGSSKAIREVFSLLSLLREQEMPVLILGESGTGKELIARIIHRQSGRSSRSFFSLNCAAFQDTLIESLLFGHIKGSFTGARSDHDGFFKQADGGTIFLDEVDEMSQAMQGKLLRVLQESEYYPVGDTRVRKTDVRILAAAKDTLPKNVESGKFREDLFYRLNVVQIKLPPLRERLEDIPLLVKHFVNDLSKEYNRRIKGIREDAETALQRYHWPGNVRQFENVMRRVFLFVQEDDWIDLDHLPEEILAIDTDTLLKQKSLPVIIEDTERKIILKVLRQCDWNRSETSRRLRISLSGLIRRIKRYNLKPEDAK